MSKGELELKVDVATAKLEAAQAKADRAKRAWDRVQQLLPQHAISASDADQIECDYKVAQAEVKEATAALEIAKLPVPKKSRGKR
jgi:multidrug efflux system membrane fusion protein